MEQQAHLDGGDPFRCVYLIAASAAALAAAMMGAAGPAAAQCTPAAPVNNTSVTCTNTVVNQNGSNGYGTRTENGLTINVEPGASVIGSTNGISVNNNNTVINAGTLGTLGPIIGDGIFGEGNLVVVNSGQVSSVTGPGIGSNGTLNVTNQAGGTITGTFLGIQAFGNGSSVFNAGTITGGNGSAAIVFFGTSNTLTLAPSSVINGNVLGTGSDTFQLTGPGNGAFDLSTIGPLQQYKGFGTFNVIGGIWTVSNAFTQTGPWTVDTGAALIVNGSLASSSQITVNSGAVLLGSGTVGSTVVNAGAAIVPTGNSPGTMNVVGDLTIQRNAFYVVQVNPLMASRLNVSGTASLDGTVAAVFAPGIYLSRSYTILTADNRRTGRFEDLETFGLPRNFRARLDYFNNSVDLNLRAQLIGGGGVGGDASVSRPIVLPPIPGLPLPPEDLPGSALPGSALPPFTSNQVNAGRAIDNFFNNGGTLPPAFVSLYGLSGANLTTALDQLSGEAATGLQQVGFQLGNQFLNLMLDPFVDGRSGVGGADHPALGFAPEREAMPPDIAHAYAAVLKEPPKAVPVYEPRWTVWGGAYGGSNRTTGDLAVVGSHDLSASTAGFAGGLDYRLTPDTVAGFAFAGGGTHWSLAQGLGGGKSDAFQAGVYGATRFGPAYLAAAFAFTNHWMSTDRTAVGDRLTADFNAQSYGGRLEGGYRFGTPYGGITPYAAIQAQSFHTPGYTETDAIANGFALTFNGRDATDTRSELGTRFDRVLAVYSNAVLALRGRVAWAHDWVSDPSLLCRCSRLSQARASSSTARRRRRIPRSPRPAPSYASPTASRCLLSSTANSPRTPPPTPGPGLCGIDGRRKPSPVDRTSFCPLWVNRVGSIRASNQMTCGSLSPHYHHRSASGSSLAAIHFARASGLARKRMNARAASGSAPSDIKAPS